jgi:hypothetical protein
MLEREGAADRTAFETWTPSTQRCPRISCARGRPIPIGPSWLAGHDLARRRWRVGKVASRAGDQKGGSCLGGTRRPHAAGYGNSPSIPDRTDPPIWPGRLIQPEARWWTLPRRCRGCARVSFTTLNNPPGTNGPKCERSMIVLTRYRQACHAESLRLT